MINDKRDLYLKNSANDGIFKLIHNLFSNCYLISKCNK